MSISIARQHSEGGTYKYIDSVDVGEDEYVDRSAAGTTQLDDSVLTGQYNYYIAYGKSGSDPSRPSEKIGPLRPAGGRIHITDLQVARRQSQRLGLVDNLSQRA